jgi:FkbM family methyltransferase
MMDLEIPQQVQPALQPVNTPWGVLIGMQRDRITQTIHAEGLYEWAETAIVSQLLRTESVAIDVGANIGYYTALFRVLVGERGAVHAFEANPLTAALLRRTQEANRWEQVVVNSVALGSTPATMRVRAMDLAEAQADGNLNLGGWTLRESKSGAWSIEVATLDRYVRDSKIEKVHFLKIDVDDFELQVLQGADRVLRKFKPYLMLEIRVNDDADRVRFEQTLEYLHQRDYACSRIMKRPFPHLRTLGGSDHADRRFHFNLLAMPGARFREYEDSINWRA